MQLFSILSKLCFLSCILNLARASNDFEKKIEKDFKDMVIYNVKETQNDANRVINDSVSKMVGDLGGQDSGALNTSE